MLYLMLFCSILLYPMFNCFKKADRYVVDSIEQKTSYKFPKGAYIQKDTRGRVVAYYLKTTEAAATSYTIHNTQNTQLASVVIKPKEITVEYNGDMPLGDWSIAKQLTTVIRNIHEQSN